MKKIFITALSIAATVTLVSCAASYQEPTQDLDKSLYLIPVFKKEF